MRKPNNEKIIVHIERTIRPYDEFYNLTYYSLQDAEKSEEGRFYNCLITMVFCAFSLEAYLNHLGAIHVPNWVYIEKEFNYSQKLKIIGKMTCNRFDMREKPFCFMNHIFDYRKLIVHGKTSHLKKNQFIVPNSIPDMPLAYWEEMTSLQKARDFRIHTKDIITTLSCMIDNDEFPLGTPSDAMWSS